MRFEFCWRFILVEIMLLLDGGNVDERVILWVGEILGLIEGFIWGIDILELLLF